jgi:hypothetical protein
VNIWVRNELVETWHANPLPNCSDHCMWELVYVQQLFFWVVSWFQKFGDFSQKIAFLFPIYNRKFGKFVEFCFDNVRFKEQMKYINVLSIN